MPTSTTKYRLRVNAYDRTSSLLVALLIVASVTVVGLLVVYFARQLIASQVAIPVRSVEGGRAEMAMGLKDELEPPGIEDVPDLFEPQLQDTLTQLTTAVSARTAMLADEDIDMEGDVGHGSSLGDRRRMGTGDGDGPAEPRREIRFEPSTIRQYAEWLDFFRIELGVLGQDNQIHYAYNLSRDRPDTRVGTPSDERRLYMNPADSQFAALDRQLAVKAGIADRGRIILQFFPPETEAILLELERQQAGGRTTEEIRRTVYRVTPVGNRFEFSVEEQVYY